MEKFKMTLTGEERTALEHVVTVGKAAARNSSTLASCSWPMRDRAGSSSGGIVVV